MATLAQFRCFVDGLEALHRLRDVPLPLGLVAAPAQRTFHRDVYLDTSDRSLSQRGVTCRLRLQSDDRRFLCLIVEGADRVPERWEAEVPELDARRALEGTTEPARRLRALTDPELLRPRIEIETERWGRIVQGGWLRRIPRFAFLYDACTVRHHGLAREFEELQVRRLAPGGPHLEQIAAALERDYGLRPILLSKIQRAQQLIETMAAESTVRMIASQRSVAVVALEGGRVAFLEDEGGSTSLPVARGSGEESVRHVLRRLFGSGVGELTLLGHAPNTDDRPALEVWLARKIRWRPDEAPAIPIHWRLLADVLARIGTEIKSPETLGALAIAARTDLGLGESGNGPSGASPGRPPALALGPATPTDRPDRVVRTDVPAEHFLNVELSQLAFHERVLELAVDPTIPLAERLRYVAIVGSNLDEFFAVRVGTLKAAIAGGSTKRSFDGRSPAEQFDAIAARVPRLVERQSRIGRDCLNELAKLGIRVKNWAELTPEQKQRLSAHFENELKPLITPRAVTLSPGHPFPLIPHLVITYAVLVRDLHTGPVHFAYLGIPSRLDRLIPVPGTADVVSIEEVVRAHLQAFYPERRIEQAWLFRVTRGAELEVNEEESGDLLQVIEEEVGRRPRNAPVRIEIERGTPPMVRDLLERELRFERRGVVTSLGEGDTYEVDGLLDWTCLRELAARAPAEAQWRPLVPRPPLPADRPMFELIDEADRLVHHPYDDFETSVGRFLEEAARDPAVVAIKMTLYRTGDRSPIADALAEAARQGKDVSTFVELKARFDEARNARWVKRLENAKVQVVYGLVGLKNHAKVMLVIRETDQGLKRYAHIGTGNYHAATSRFYTDLGLFTADPLITADLVDLFNELTGSSRAPAGTYRRLLVSPTSMVKELIRRIEREIEFAQTEKGGRIRIQVNGLEDPEIVGALYRASQAGVRVDLVIRGLCVLRPAVQGLSENIQVRSVLGRFLEHERIYHFGNGGDDDYLIGSCDLRPRNLRRRVEVLTPVERPELEARLDRILTALLEEPTAWVLTADGQYVRLAEPDAARPHVHTRLAGPS
jgi:polyphosphate kinase